MVGSLAAKARDRKSPTKKHRWFESNPTNLAYAWKQKECGYVFADACLEHKPYMVLRENWLHPPACHAGVAGSMPARIAAP